MTYKIAYLADVTRRTARSARFFTSVAALPRYEPHFAQARCGNTGAAQLSHFRTAVALRAKCDARSRFEVRVRFFDGRPIVINNKLTINQLPIQDSLTACR